MAKQAGAGGKGAGKGPGGKGGGAAVAEPEVLEEGAEGEEGLEEESLEEGIDKGAEEGEEGEEGQEGEELEDKVADGEEEDEDAADGEEGEEGTEDVASLREQIALLTETVEKLKNPPKAAEEPKPMSEEDWKKLEEDWGIAADKDGVPGSFGRKSIQQIARLIGNMSQNLREVLNTELGGFKKEAAIAELAREKGFEDIKVYRKGIDEFLSDFDTRFHSDKKLLKKAVTYARGLTASGKLKKAVNTREMHRKVNTGAAHGKPGGKGAAKTVVLTAEQKQAARAAKMPESEYIKYLTTDNLEDIDLPE
jgi:hypothetical protein